MSDSWIEPRTRVPIIGIVAIVVIVAVVAVFIKTQLSPLFPTNDVTVQSASDLKATNAQGQASASSSFIGQREISLQRKERLIGTVVTSAYSRTFVVDVPAKLLIIKEQGTQEEIVLQDNGASLLAIFDYNNVKTRVDIDPTGRMLIYSEPGKSAEPIQVALRDLVDFEGYFTFRNAQYLFQFYPASASYATITAAKTDTIPLTQDGQAYAGTWNDGQTARPVTIDMTQSLATIDNVY